MKGAAWTVAFFATLAAALAGLAPPQIGFAQDSVNSLRPVYGVAGNFVLGDAAADGVVAAAFSGLYGLLKTDSSVLATDRLGQVLASFDAEAGPALFAFSSNGAPAFVYLSESGTLLQWRNGAFARVFLDSAALAGPVAAIAAPDLDHAEFFVQRESDLWDVRISLDNGQVDSQSVLAGITAPLLALPSRDFVYSDSSGLILRRADASEIHIAAHLPERFSLQQMGEEWLQIRDLDDGHSLAVRIAAGKESSYQLPDVSP